MSDKNEEDKKNNLQNLPIRAYLDQTVVPLLLQSLTELVRERPANPIEFVAQYLLANNPENAQAQEKK
ncbi:Dpy-30 motif protein (macronuclear) [Tetrahymena thermophila SB210]|uniref:Protein dpy-30 homolog n=1 Tax=Tetrahymena thermophila (strain SB210) TaxID=312017 RepID=I7LWQ5_TETTS|nr:Dpy-30 motif protein [Tetrahymena thermophila SB210]EAS02656.2 Dpy-30 motif protein [Tetrahymena thermophila SB210]|eukprot:XP_001022901.2 Dpy-30 motif protein [Tetrahymena thermophila SB210]